MKNFLTMLVYVLILAFCFPQENIAQSRWEGSTLVSTPKSKSKMELTKTPFLHKTLKGEVYVIYINKENGRCYTKRVSKTTGIERNQPMSEEDSKEVCRKLGIEYTYKKKSRK